MGRCQFRLADMMPSALFHKIKHMSSGRKHDPSPIYNSKGPASPSLRRHNSTIPIPTRYFCQPSRSHGGRSGRRRSVHKASTSLGRRVSSSSNWGHRSSPAPGLISFSPVTETEANTDIPDLIPRETDSSRDSVEIDYMETGGVLSSSSSFSPHSNLLHERFYSSTMHLTVELDDPHSTRIMAPKAKTLDKKESCEIEHTPGWSLSRGNMGVKLRQNTALTGRRRKSQEPIPRRFLSTSPQASRLMVKFTNKNLGASLAMVKSSHNPKRDFRESIAEMITENKVQTRKDLEDLLAGYLSLNSTIYHRDIINAFEQIRVKMSVHTL